MVVEPIVNVESIREQRSVSRETQPGLMEKALQVELSPRGGAQTRSFGEFAVLAGWFFFACSLVQWTVSLVICCCQRKRGPPRQPGRVIEAEVAQQAQTSWSKDKARGDERARDASPLKGGSVRRSISMTPEKKIRSGDLSTSPEARLAQSHILEAMVQRAQPVVQDLQEMHRLGGQGPGPMLRRGTRLQEAQRG